LGYGCRANDSRSTVEIAVSFGSDHEGMRRRLQRITGSDRAAPWSETAGKPGGTWVATRVTGAKAVVEIAVSDRAMERCEYVSQTIPRIRPWSLVGACEYAAFTRFWPGLALEGKDKYCIPCSGREPPSQAGRLEVSERRCTAHSEWNVAYGLFCALLGIECCFAVKRTSPEE
jgi:hypothetical protein